MGQVGSTGEFTQEGIKEIKDVKETDVMMNLIFRYMLKQIMVTDLMKLSEPDTCKEYVVSLAQHMSSQFSRLQIMPYKEKKSDVLLFKKYSDLDPSKKSEMHSEEEKRSLCLLLSYYYVRIFQIYGALALTLLNDISSSEATLKASKDYQRPVNQTPGYGTTRVVNIKQHGGTLGGADTVDTPGKLRDTIFKFLNPEDKTSYLVGEYSEKNGWKTKYDASSQATGGRAYFKITGTRINTTGGVDTTTMLGEFYLYAPATQDRYLTLFVEATPTKGMNYDVTLQYTKLKSSDTTLVALPSSLKNADVSIRSGDGTTYTVHIKEKSTTTTKQIPAYFQEVFYDLISEFSLKVKKPTSDGEFNEEGTPEPFKLKTTIGALQDRRTTGHCIARALQLLRTIPSTVRGGPPSYESDICMEKFSFTTRTFKGEVSSGTSTRGIPTYGTSLASTPGADTRGFRSLVQLFYDTNRIGSPRIIISDQAFTEYTNFMKTMAHLFKDTDSAATKEMQMDKGLIEIKNRRDKGMCDELQLKDKTMPVDSRVNINAVSEVVKELYQIQVKHAKKCGDIFKLLFDIAYDEKRNPLTISLSKNVLQGGFEEINRINGLTRKVLIDYYSDCEYKYVQGVNLIVEPIRQSRKAALTGAPLALQRSYSAPTPGAAARPAASTATPATPATPAVSTGATRPGAASTASTGARLGGGSFTAKAGRKIAYTRKRHVMRQ